MDATQSTAADAIGTGRLAGWARAVIGGAVDAVLPPQCGSCRAPVATGAALCAPCWSAVDFIERPYCEQLGTPFPYDPGEGTLSAAAMANGSLFDRVRSVAHHRGPARDLVLALKFGDRVDLAPMMGAWMARAGRDALDGADIVIPVPLHWLRRIRRRHNQAALLARHVAAQAGLPMRPAVLRRIRRTRQQTGLSASARARNVRGAFAIGSPRTGDFSGRRVVLIDDVLTTGATVEACARILKRAGAESVNVLTFSRVVETGAEAI